MKKYDWYLFDLDNTILDFNIASNRAFEETLIHCKVIPNKDNAAIYHDINKSYWIQYEKGLINSSTLREGRFEDFLKEINHEHDALEMSQIYLDFLLKNSHEIAGSIQVLDKLLKTANLALITNGLSDVQHKRIEKHQLKDYFQHIFISDEMGVSKPATGFFEIVHSKINMPNKKEVLVIGDNPISDIQGATNFGYDSLYYNYGKNDDRHVEATYKIDSWENF
jgi:2-haloacid dehalogenase